MISAVSIILVTLMLGIGLAGTILPGVPGVGLVFAGILFYALATDFTQVTTHALIWFGVFSALALVADVAGTAIGTKLGGGMRGAFIGLTLGIILSFFAPFGFFSLLITPILGAFIGATAYDKMGTAPALRVAIMSSIGMLGGIMAQFAIALCMIIVFLAMILF